MKNKTVDIHTVVDIANQEIAINKIDTNRSIDFTSFITISEISSNLYNYLSNCTDRTTEQQYGIYLPDSYGSDWSFNKKKYNKKFIRINKPENINPLTKNNVKEWIRPYSIQSWISFLISYIKFLRFAEKSYFYNIETSNRLRYSIDKENDLFELEVNSNLNKITISIEKTKIPDINSSSGLLDSFFDPDIKNSTRLTFVTIDIERDYSRRLHNTFKFLSTDQPTFNDDSDKLLFDNLKRIVTDIAIDEYFDILVHIVKLFKIPKYLLSDNNNITIKDVEVLLNYGLCYYKL